MGAMATGAAVGTGSAIAHRAIGGLFGGGGGYYPASSGQPVEAGPATAPSPSQMLEEQNPCGGVMKSFAECMSATGGDMGACRSLYDAMQRCRLGPAAAAGADAPRLFG